MFSFCKFYDFSFRVLDWELIKEGDEIILEGKNIKLSHVNHVPNSIADKTTLHRQGWLL